MDTTKIIVVVMVLIAVGFLVYFEMNSRRNTREQLKAAATKDNSPDATKAAR